MSSFHTFTSSQETKLKHQGSSSGTRVGEFPSDFSTMKWVPGDIIGYGGFSTVRKAKTKKQSPNFPKVMAVKSSSLSFADMLLHEESILKELKDCPHIIHCFGHDHTKENGRETFNLFLEYASRGSLAHRLRKQTKRRFQESEVRRYTKSILEGVDYIHKNGYVHRDLKPENILLCSSTKRGSRNDTLKIADFGLARRYGERNKEEKAQLAGTALYYSPEAVDKGEQEPPSDVWAIGCMVVKMFTGAPAWRCRPGEDAEDIMTRILLKEIPEIPKDLSLEGQDFLRKIFIKDPAKRWTAKMLMHHPFVANLQSSPKGPLDRKNCNESSDSTCSVTKQASNKGSNRISFAEKVRRLLTCEGQDW